MVNTYLRKNHQGEWVDKTPDMWASVYEADKFLLAVRRYGAEADFGRVLFDIFCSKRDVTPVIFAAKDFGLELLAERFASLAEKRGIVVPRIVPDTYVFDEVEFKYRVERNGKIYFTVLNRTRHKPRDLKRALKELDERAQL